MHFRHHLAPPRKLTLTRLMNHLFYNPTNEIPSLTSYDPSPVSPPTCTTPQPTILISSPKSVQPSHLIKFSLFNAVLACSSCPLVFCFKSLIVFFTIGYSYPFLLLSHLELFWFSSDPSFFINPKSNVTQLQKPAILFLFKKLCTYTYIHSSIHKIVIDSLTH